MSSASPVRPAACIALISAPTSGSCSGCWMSIPVSVSITAVGPEIESSASAHSTVASMCCPCHACRTASAHSPDIAASGGPLHCASADRSSSIRWCTSR